MATRIPFGLRDGRMVSVDQVPRGLACGAVCPTCKSQLIARQGLKNEHHFAHRSVAECVAALETSLHLMAKQLLAETRQIKLPALTAEGRATSPDGEPVFVDHTHQSERVVTFDEVVLEPREGSIIPDARCTRDGRTCYVEFWVTHASSAEKRAEFARRGFAAVEVRLRPGPALSTVAGVKAALSGSVKDREWLWHPRAEDAREAARQRAVAQGVRDAEQRAAARRRAAPVVQYRRVYVARRPARTAARAPWLILAQTPSPKLYLYCVACRKWSEWPNTLPPDYEPSCPTCERPVGRDVVTMS